MWKIGAPRVTIRGLIWCILASTPATWATAAAIPRGLPDGALSVPRLALSAGEFVTVDPRGTGALLGEPGSVFRGSGFGFEFLDTWVVFVDLADAPETDTAAIGPVTPPPGWDATGFGTAMTAIRTDRGAFEGAGFSDTTV